MAKTIVAQIAAKDSLEKAWRKIRANVPAFKRDRMDALGQSINSIDKQLDRHLSDIARDLLAPAGYQFNPLTAYTIPKKNKKYRVICVPPLLDRLVQRAILNYVSAGNRFRVLNSVSFGFISDPEKSVKTACKQAVTDRQTHPWAYKTDITQFFDRLPRDQLMSRISTVCRSPPLKELLRRALSCEIAPGSARDQEIIRSQGIRTGIGVRQGMPLSPMFANVLLRGFDRAIQRKKIRMIRYADDLIALADSRDECLDIHATCESELKKVGLLIPAVDATADSKTQIADPDKPIEFLGASLERDRSGQSYILCVPQEAIDKVRDKLANFGVLTNLSRSGITIATLGKTFSDLRDGWLEAYSHCNNVALVKNAIDGWISKAMQRLFGEDFGINLSSLGEEHRKFLLL
jgi:RNA-directed DNA polymerase